ncbi:MAG: PQQ-binding-like beta-propeller repeat protein [Verrucomicrobiota bacterium]
MKSPILVGLLILIALSPIPANEWPRFRGINGSGVNENAEIPVTWTEEEFLFDVELPGIGHGSPVVYGNRVFLLCADEKTFERMPVCLDATTGELLWKDKVETGKFKGHRFNSPASNTPAADGEQVYFCWGTKEELSVVAYSHDGEERWSKNLGPVVGGHGFGASPAVYGDLVVINNDQDKGNGSLIALDTVSGDVKWKIDRKSERLSYSTPCEVVIDGKSILIFTNWQHGFTSVDLESGEVLDELATFDLTTNERAISSPIVHGDLVIGTCGFTANPKHCVAVRVRGDGKLEEVWRIERSVPHIPSPLLVGDLVFLWDDKGILTCVDPQTGEEYYRERVPTRGTSYGSPVSDGKTIFNVDDGGNVHAVAVSRGFKVLGMSALKELSRSSPAIANGNLYLRTFTRLIAVRGKSVTG